MSILKSVIIIDWFSFTCFSLNEPGEVIHLIGLDDLSWELCPGRNGYKEMLFSNNISIMYNGLPGMGIFVNMSGQGCRVFESYSETEFNTIFAMIVENNKDFNITRLDVAYDDRHNKLDINVIANKVRNIEYVSKSKNWEVHESNKGISVGIGSMRSLVYIRIYDKAMERGFDPEDDVNWIRLELQLRDERAFEFISKYLSSTGELGVIFVGVINNYLRFVEPGNDSNKRRWSVSDWWADILGDIETRITLFTSCCVDYNLHKLEKFALGQAGGAIQTYIQIKGVNSFVENLFERDFSPNKNYESLKDEFKRYGVDVLRDYRKDIKNE